jgi:dihydroorotase
MPNLKPPVTDRSRRRTAYRKRILAALPRGARFEPLMTLYLTTTRRPDEIERAAKSGIVRAVKYYPAGRPPIPDSGVSDIRNATRRSSDAGRGHAALVTAR